MLQLPHRFARRPIVDANVYKRSQVTVLFAAALSFGAATCAAQHKNQEETTVSGPGTLWREPLDIASRDLYYGPGGEAHRPQPPFQFVKEDLEASSPKFTVTDKAKLRSIILRGRSDGYCMTKQEAAIGFCAVAVPLRRVDGSAIGAISIPALAERVVGNPDILNTFLKVLREQVDALGRQLI